MHRFAQRRSAPHLATDERARAGGERAGLSPILQVQRVAGNQAVLGLMQRDLASGRSAAAKGIEGEDEPIKAEKVGAGKGTVLLERLVALEAGHAHVHRYVGAPALQRAY